MLVLEHEMTYSDQQKVILRNAIENNVHVADIKNSGMPTNLMEAYIELRMYGYDIEYLEDHKLGLLSITYLDCIRELARNNIDIYQLIYGDGFIPYTNRQILTVTDGLLKGLDLKLFGNIKYDCIEMRNIIDNIAS